METLLAFQGENELNEGQECGTLKELTHVNVTERQSLNSEQPNHSVETEIKGRPSVPSQNPENMTQAITACATIDAEESDFQGRKQSRHTSESEVGSDNVSKKGGQRVLQALQMASDASVALTDIPTVPQQKLSDQEDPPIGTSSGANQAGSGFPPQHCPSTNGTGRLGKLGGSSGGLLLYLSDIPLLPTVGKGWTEHAGVNCKVSLAGETGLAGEGCQAEACAVGSELGQKEVERRWPVVGNSVSGTPHCAGRGTTISKEDQECPVCIELYDSGAHKQALLNCNHSICDSCIKTIMEKAEVNSISQMCCPICRQRTPMPEWEIRQLQEEMTFLNQAVAGRLSVVPMPPAPRQGPFRRLEQTFRQRVQTTRRCGYLPCLRYPLWLVNALAKCDQTYPCCYLCSILLLYGLELLCLSLIFTPLIILILLFTLLDKQ
ncbi:hypothetical protein scyTo_0021748 [Scyliorhinus torazame]|uniref:E3 ubiquitin-protein ligase RNF182 n=1 Tax=Scyliorhinus torazame TaxID=75743 RepID=A0A401Q6D5_SCYTO|nr:hypothetical protein [Scyliorhinus torazame]